MSPWQPDGSPVEATGPGVRLEIGAGVAVGRAQGFAVGLAVAQTLGSGIGPPHAVKTIGSESPSPKSAAANERFMLARVTGSVDSGQSER